MQSKINICLCLLALFVCTISCENDSLANLIESRSEEMLKLIEKEIVQPNVSGNLITRIHQSIKNLKRKTAEFQAIPNYSEILTNKKSSSSQEVFQEQNYLQTNYDLLKIIQKLKLQSAMDYAKKLSNEMHEILKLHPKNIHFMDFTRELKELDEVIAESFPDYLQWYHESKVIEKMFPLLEIKLSITGTARF